MKTDKEFTESLKAYMALPEEQRDIMEGAALLLKLNRNRFMFANISRRPDKYAGRLFYELDKYLRMRLAADTGMALAALEKRVKSEVLPNIEKHEAKYQGKRPDHDSLPDGIKALYVDNANILKEMRDLHAKLRIKSSDKYRPCDRYDDITALLALHDRYVANWAAYDHAEPVAAAGAPCGDAAGGTTEDASADGKKRGRKKAVPDEAQ